MWGNKQQCGAELPAGVKPQQEETQIFGVVYFVYNKKPHQTSVILKTSLWKSTELLCGKITLILKLFYGIGITLLSYLKLGL